MLRINPNLGGRSRYFNLTETFTAADGSDLSDLSSVWADAPATWTITDLGGGDFGVMNTPNVTNQYTSNFTVGTDTWVASNGAVARVAGPVEGVSDVLEYTVDGTNASHFFL